jgi:hypothetical protein
LGGKPAVINPASPDEDAEVGDDTNFKYSFFKVSNDTGKLLCSEITDRPLTR